MLIIGEKINSSLKGIKEALETKDRDFLVQLATSQVEAGAHLLDVNAAIREQAEPADLEWLVKIVQEAADCPLCIDSPNPEAIQAALRVHKGKAMVNSVTGEDERLHAILPLVKKYQCQVIGLAHDRKEIPNNSADRVLVAEHIVEIATKQYGIPVNDIFIDPLVIPVSTDFKQGLVCIDTIKVIKERIPGVQTVSGLSNVSYGLPNRRFINHVFLILAIQMGLDAAILNPLDIKLMSNLKITELLLGNDPDCRKYLKANRQGLLQF